MVIEWKSHDQFWQSLVTQLSKWSGSLKKKRILKNYQETLAKVWLTDLSKAIPILESCYASSKRGKVPRDPLAMLRSFLVMGLEGFVSITSPNPKPRQKGKRNEKLES